MEHLPKTTEIELEETAKEQNTNKEKQNKKEEEKKKKKDAQEKQPPKGTPKPPPSPPKAQDDNEETKEEKNKRKQEKNKEKQIEQEQNIRYQRMRNLGYLLTHFNPVVMLIDYLLDKKLNLWQARTLVGIAAGLSFLIPGIGLAMGIALILMLATSIAAGKEPKLPKDKSKEETLKTVGEKSDTVGIGAEEKPSNLNANDLTQKQKKENPLSSAPEVTSIPVKGSEKSLENIEKNLPNQGWKKEGGILKHGDGLTFERTDEKTLFTLPPFADEVSTAEDSANIETMLKGIGDNPAVLDLNNLDDKAQTKIVGHMNAKSDDYKHIQVNGLKDGVPDLKQSAPDPTKETIDTPTIEVTSGMGMHS